jgi:hypothetical protein
MSIHGCIACGHCYKSEGNRCVFTDDCVNETAQKMREADGLSWMPDVLRGHSRHDEIVPGSRVLHQLPLFSLKVANSCAVVRRAGGVDVVHQLNNYLNSRRR